MTQAGTSGACISSSLIHFLSLCRSWRNYTVSENGRPRQPSVSFASGGHLQAIMPSSSSSAAASSTAASCQANYDPRQNIEYPHPQLATSQDCLPSFVPSTSASAIDTNAYAVVPYSKSSNSSNRAGCNESTESQAGRMEKIMQVSTKNSISDHVDDSYRKKSFVRPQNLRHPDPGTRTTRSAKAAAQRRAEKAIVHHAREDTETVLPTTTSKVDLPGRTKAEQVLLDLASELTKCMMTELGPSNESELTQNLEAIIKERMLKLVKPETGTDKTERDENMEVGGMSKKTCFKCPHPGCEKHKESASDLKYTHPIGPLFSQAQTFVPPTSHPYRGVLTSNHQETHQTPHPPLRLHLHRLPQEIWEQKRLEASRERSALRS